jgi:MtrB/PioB family decaheme-associated outer membrane protein
MRITSPCTVLTLCVLTFGLSATQVGAQTPAQDPPAQNPSAQNPPTQNPPGQNPPAQNPPAQNIPPQQAPPDVTTDSEFGGGQVDVGLRGTIYGNNSDEARYQRYRDLRNGAIADYLRASRDAGTWSWHVQADHIGYNDQRYFADYWRPGKLKVTFEFNQIPLFVSQDTATPYTNVGGGNLQLQDVTQQAIQAGTATLADYVPISPKFDLQLKRSITQVHLIYNATPDLDLSVNFRNTKKSGEQQWAGTFGFSNAVEFPLPVDTNTTDFGLAGEWAKDNYDVRAGYDGSFFRNSNQVITWDNPLRLTDDPTAGPGAGRESVWPDSNVNTGWVSGLMKLPERSVATAYLSIGNWSQNQTLIPFTVNSALTSPTLDRATADAKAKVTGTAFSFNTRAFEDLALNARFRTYDFNNQTPVFNVTQTVSYDTSVAAFAPGTNTIYSFTRKTFDADASWTGLHYAALRAAYTRDNLSQTFRTFDSQHEDYLRLSADTMGLKNVTFRGVYEFSNRNGNGLDEQSLDDIGEQTSLRQFDISNRKTNRFSGIAIAQVNSNLSVNGTVFVGTDHRPDTTFGLQQNDNHGVGFGFDYVPDEKVSAGASYQYESYHTLQMSRQASSGADFNDPTKDWTTDAKDHAHTIQASVDLLKFWEKTDVRLAYDFSYATSLYIYGLPPDTTLPAVAQLPQVLNRRHRITADARRTFTHHLGGNVMIWYETYHVDDFAFSPVTLDTIAQPSFLTLGYLYRPYTAATIQARLTYIW